ncbi:hypothetical protein SELMODRAFT_437770 [Selaginella moellendorffii]|uniref:Pentacotripeptide-repeat region of PRORP domain-containing protein n=1 Tax=Selaginella moellendorffii TaxID=88036 RepID=D8QTI0_SELML|nr:hypothetical protein SELMODRAFT_437770 [Selaginella moellendorffii]
MIDAYVRHGCGHDALELYTKMNLEGVRADEICLASVLAACSATGDERTGRRLHSHVVLDRELSASIEDPRALSFYLDMQREGRVRADAFVFASSITACANLQTLEKGEMIHRRIVSSGLERDRPVENAVLNLYVKCATLDAMRREARANAKEDIVTLASGAREKLDHAFASAKEVGGKIAHPFDAGAREAAHGRAEGLRRQSSEKQSSLREMASRKAEEERLVARNKVAQQVLGGGGGMRYPVPVYPDQSQPQQNGSQQNEQLQDYPVEHPPRVESPQDQGGSNEINHSAHPVEPPHREEIEQPPPHGEEPAQNRDVSN